MIRVLIVDDEQLIREGAAKTIGECLPDAELTVLGTASAAIAEAEKRDFDIAFLDIEMPGMKGTELAKRIKELSPNTNIIFSTAYPQYAGVAFDLHASGYIVKPLTKEKVMAEIDALRYPIDSADRGLRIQAFGNFEVFLDGKPGTGLVALTAVGEECQVEVSVWQLRELAGPLHGGEAVEGVRW